MKQTFIYQEGNSRKFWSIEIASKGENTLKFVKKQFFDNGKLAPEFEFKTILWEKEISISLDMNDIDLSELEEITDDTEKLLTEYIKRLNNSIKWVNENKETIVRDLLVEEGLEDIADSIRPYIKKLNISLEDFKKAFCPASIDCYMDYNDFEPGFEEIRFKLRTTTNSDYFNHFIVISLVFNKNGDYRIDEISMLG